VKPLKLPQTLACVALTTAEGLIEVDDLRPFGAEYAYLTMGSSDNDSSELVSLGPWVDAGVNPAQLLIGTANLAQYFGIEPDVVLGPPFPLRPESGWIYSCGLVEYGPSGNFKVNSCEGQAIHWVSPLTVELTEPAPLNSRGERGNLVGCGLTPAGGGPSADGGMPVDASSGFAPLCTQLYPEPNTEPTTPEPDPLSPSVPGTPSEPGEAGADSSTAPPPVMVTPNQGDASTDDTAADDDTSVDDSSVGTALPSRTDGPSGEVDAPEAGVHNRSADAASDRSPAQDVDGAVDPGVVQRGVNETEDASGCNCTFGTEQTTPAAPLATLALLLTLLKRRSRRRQSSSALI
jgi:MYXO-CTERM domain-containing protein